MSVLGEGKVAAAGRLAAADGIGVWAAAADVAGVESDLPRLVGLADVPDENLVGIAWL
jgi:hypothetical protein